MGQILSLRAPPGIMTGLATLVTRDVDRRTITFRMLTAAIGTSARTRVLLPTGFVLSMLAAFLT
jgi:hypothetical protein